MRKSVKIVHIICAILGAVDASASIASILASETTSGKKKSAELQRTLDDAQAALAAAQAANAREQAELAYAQAAHAAALKELDDAKAANAREQRDKVALQEIISNLQGTLRAVSDDTASAEQIQALNAELAAALASLQALQDASGGGSTGGGSTGVSETKAEIDVKDTLRVLGPLVASIGTKPVYGTAAANAEIVAAAYTDLEARIAALLAAQGASGTPSGGAGGSSGGGSTGGSSGGPPSEVQAPISATNVVPSGGQTGSTGGSVPPASGPASNPSSGGTSGGQTGSTGGPEMTPGGSGTPTGGPSGVAVVVPTDPHGTCPTPNANDLTVAELLSAIMGKLTSGDTGLITVVAKQLGLWPSESSTTDAAKLPLGPTLIGAIAEGALPHGGQ